MPELPDVERYRRMLEDGAMRRRIAKVAVSDKRILVAVTPQALGARLAGAEFVETRRRGKHLLVRLDRGGWLALHFGMSGAVVVVHRDAEPPAYSRVRFEFADGGQLAYVSRRMLGRVSLADDAEAFFREQELGPDALHPALDRRAFVTLLSGTRQGAKAALMNQRLIAGIGNIYADEILFQARLHPKARLDALDDSALARLYEATRGVLEEAIARGAGSEEFLDRLPSGYLLPYRTKGGKCPRCGTPLATLKLGGRTGWYCPRCQPDGTS